MIDTSVFEINYVVVVVAAVAYMIVAMLWYSEALFGKLWRLASGRPQADFEAAIKQGMAKPMAIATLSALVMSFVVAHFVDLVGATTFIDAVTLSFWAWLGYVVTVQISSVLWDGRTWTFFAINATHSFVSLLVMTSILTLWI